MHQRKSKKLIIYFFLLFILGSINNITITNFKFDEIKKIEISGLDDGDSKILLKQIQDLNLKNIFFINKNEINQLIDSNTLVENYFVTKKYPSSIDIKLEKTEFLAKINENGSIFLIGTNGKLSLNKQSNDHLPYIFGKPNIAEFLKFKKSIDNSKILYSDIKNLYFFPSKRWDLKLKNNILLKLPKNFNSEILNNIYIFLNDQKLNEFSIIDARIKNQIILNE